MATSQISKNENKQKGNSSDTLLAIYILKILKKYSSPKKWISTGAVCEYLSKDYPFAVCNENTGSQTKKVRRYLDTLSESYEGGCVRKKEGKSSREGFEWCYDASKDDLEVGETQSQETLTELEAELLVDLVSATKILNSDGTRGLAYKLLKKTSLSDKERAKKLEMLRKEEWFKSPNSDLAEKKETIEEYFYDYCLVFDYEDEKAVTATPYGWSYEDGICYLNAKVGDKNRKFALDKIRILSAFEDECNSDDCFTGFDRETDSDKTSLDSLLVNIPTIKSAISDKKCIKFLYRSYAVDGRRVVSKDNEKCVLPHSLVFNDGKYYLIGIDADAPENNKIAYFRVDLMFELERSDVPIKLSEYNEYIFDAIERARVVEKHPFMEAERDVAVTFKVVESALDRVADAFGIAPDMMSKMRVTDETRAVKDSSENGFHDERTVMVDVRTSKTEAFRWALSNADAVEVASQDIRDSIARIADPIYQLYTQTLPDKVRENIDYVLKEGTFKISYMVDADTAYATYKELAKTGRLGAVENMGIADDAICDGVDYFGEFTNTERLIIHAPKITDFSWAAGLVNLETLKVESSEAVDASWMKDMKKLKRLYLTQSSFSDLSVLSEHKEIYDIDISGTNVSDISFIENFEELTQLSIAVCPIEDYSPLFTTKSRLKHLEIDRKALEKIGEEKIRSRHIGINIRVTNNSPFWYL